MIHVIDVAGPRWPEPVPEWEIAQLSAMERDLIALVLERLSPTLYGHLRQRRTDLIRELAEASPAMYRSIVAQLRQEVSHA